MSIMAWAGLPLEGHGGDYYHSEQIAGCKSLGIWPLSRAAEACFGRAQWPTERPVPQVSIEFDVADAGAVAMEAFLGSFAWTQRGRRDMLRRAGLS
jgi:hypothetical protein